MNFSKMKKISLALNLFFITAIVLNFAFWTKSRHVHAEWGNVPPAPSGESARFSGLGDPEISYRLIGYFLQNIGNVGGQFQPLKDYDYNKLGEWFSLSSTLDPQSDYVPFLAAYYFGSVENAPDKFPPLVSYLAKIGMEPYPQKWRWLAQAVFIAQYKEKNLPKALELAQKLSVLPGDDVAAWARQMPAFINLKMGNKDAAYELMIRMLVTEGDKLHPNEVNYIKDFICTRALDASTAAKNPLCAAPQ